MKKWEYAKVVFNRNHKPSEFAIECSDPAMSDIDSISGLDIDGFLKAAGERGWELATTLLPFAPGKKLYADLDAEEDTSFYVDDPLDIQWLIFKREM